MANTEIKWTTAEFFRLAESPLWDGLNNRLYWVDIPAGNVHALDFNNQHRAQWHFDGPVGSLGLAQSGKLVIAIAGSVHLFDSGREKLTLLAQVEKAFPMTRLNDGKVGPDGAFWVGSMDERPAKEEIGALYRVTGDGRVERKIDGLKVSNGLAWSQDSKFLFHSDSRGPWIDRWSFDSATGEISGRKRLRTLSEAEGRLTERPATRRAATGAAEFPPAVSTASELTARCLRRLWYRFRRPPCCVLAPATCARLS